MAHGLEVEYKYSVSARTPNQSTGPTLTEIDELVPVGSVSYTDELNFDGEASLSVEPENVPSDIGERLKDLRSLPCELNIIRDDIVKWKGPILSCQLQGPTLTINARGLMYYMRYMALEADLLFTAATDQYTIGKGLVDAYQALDYGNYGIDTSGIGTSGVTRTRRFFFKENQNVFKRLIELAEQDNGFDVWVDANRDLQFASPRGTDLTLEVYADPSNIINPNIFWSTAEDNIASNAIAVGTDATGELASVVGTDEVVDVQETFGRATIFSTAEDVTSQATIDNHATRLLETRQVQLFVPGPEALPVAGATPADFGPGDTIQYLINAGRLGQIHLERRVRMLRTVVADDGAEDMQIEFI